MAIEKACMVAHYVLANDGSGDDMVYINERVRDEHGNETTNIRMVENYQMDFYVTKPAIQKTHKQKKEFETLENLRKYTVNEGRKAKAIAKVLGVHTPKPYLGDLKKSPYLYGADLTPTVAIRKAYRDKYPMYTPDSNMATLDYETNTYSTVGEIISGVVTYKDKHILAVSKAFINSLNIPVEEAIQEMYKKHLAKDITDRSAKLYIRIAEDAMGVIRTLIGSLHKLRPDFVAVWGLGFDMGKMLEEMKRSNVDPKNIFSAPDVPQRFKYCKWLEDPQRKTTATGKEYSKHFADLWHKLHAPASFQFVDMMSFYKHHRVAKTNPPDFKFDTISMIETKRGKLKLVDEIGNLPTLEWHKVMQRHHKIEYLIYNIFDCLGMELIDDATKDISRSLNATCGISDPSRLFSGPSLLRDNLHYHLLDEGKIICSTSPNMTEAFDRLTLSMNNWIATVSSKLIAAKGTEVIKDVPGITTRLFTHAFDVDIKSGYPTTQVIMNIAKHTTLREVCGITGIPEEEQRRCGVDMTAMRTNSIDLGQSLYGLPSMSTVLSRYRTSKV